MNIARPAFLVSKDRAAEPGLFAANWPVIRVEELASLNDLRRLSLDFVFPLVSSSAGHVQGMLEFLGLPYAGASAEGFVWAMRQNSLQPPVESANIRQYILHSGQNKPVQESAENASQRFLRLTGWVLVATHSSEAKTRVVVDVSPKLIPDDGFLKLLEESGASREHFFQAEVEAGLARFHVSRTLKTRYKDTI